MLTCTSMGCCKIDQSRHSLNLEIGEVARVLLERRQKVALSMLMRELRHEVATVPGGNRDRSCILPRLGKIWATCSTIRGDPNPPSNVYAKAYRQCLTTQTLCSIWPCCCSGETNAPRLQIIGVAFSRST